MPRSRDDAKAEARSRLLAAAAEQFAARGFEAANVDDVAVAAGYGKGTIYNYFRSKDDLFAEVVAEACRRTVARAAALPSDGSARERLQALAAADVAVLREDEGFMKVVVREAMGFQPRTYPLIVSHLEPYLAAVADVLAAGARAGTIRTDLPPAQLALEFVALLTILYVQHWGTGGFWPSLDEIPELAVTLFLDGAGAGPRRGDPR